MGGEGAVWPFEHPQHNNNETSRQKGKRMHRRGHPRADPPRLQRQHPFALPSCVSASVLEALPTGQDHIRYSQPKSNQRQRSTSQFHKSVCGWSQMAEGRFDNLALGDG
jgi:hypothetical protein